MVLFFSRYSVVDLLGSRPFYIGEKISEARLSYGHMQRRDSGYTGMLIMELPGRRSMDVVTKKNMKKVHVTMG